MRPCSALHCPDGARLSRSSRRRRNPDLLRGRFRTFFFLFVAALALLLGHRLAVAPAVIGALVGVYSIKVARRRGGDLAHTFVVVDWLLLGCTLALSGGADSWLLATIPVLALGHLAGASRHEWPYLMAPVLVLLLVLAIADPSLGGSQIGGIAKVAVLVVGGWVAATRLQRRPVRRQHTTKVDDATGLSTGACLPSFLEARAATALAENEPVSVVFARLEHYEDSRNFLGAQRSDELVRSVARRAERRLTRDGRTFRVGPDSLVLVLPGCTPDDARQTAATLAHDVAANLIAGRRQTLAVGTASFPTVRSIGDLLAIARDAAAPSAVARPAVAPVLPLAAAR